MAKDSVGDGVMTSEEYEKAYHDGVKAACAYATVRSIVLNQDRIRELAALLCHGDKNLTHQLCESYSRGK